MSYRVNEIVYSIQGEGARAGLPMVFLRFSGCNLRCSFCDTDHQPHTVMSAQQILEAIQQYPCKYVSLCGGEPTLQADEKLLSLLKLHGYRLGIETNGTRPVNWLVDYVVCSPKVSGNVVAKNFPGGVDELKYVVDANSDIPTPPVAATHLFLSPLFNGDMRVPANVDRAVYLALHNPPWKVTIQMHKMLGVA